MGLLSKCSWWLESKRKRNWAYSVAVEGSRGVETRCRGSEGRCCEQGGEQGSGMHGDGGWRVAVGEMEGDYVG